MLKKYILAFELTCGIKKMAFVPSSKVRGLSKNLSFNIFAIGFQAYINHNLSEIECNF